MRSPVLILLFSLLSGQNYSPDSYTKIQENYINQIRKIEQQNSNEDLSNDINQSREQFTINSGDTVRTFDAFFPSGDSLGSMPMVIIMHGLGGSTTDMQGLNGYFLPLGMVPVYPQALYYEDLPTVGSTTIFNYGAWPELYDDVAFVSDIIDYMVENYDIDGDRIYSTGMSNGGFMTYRLACDLADKITAFASVTGNMYVQLDGIDCLDQGREVPILHIHGTYDTVVPYYIGGFSIFGNDIPGDETLTITESIDFWSDYNNLTVETIDTLMTGGGYFDWYGNWIETSSTKYTYSSETSNVQFVHIQAEGGGHIWFMEMYGWGFDSHVEAYEFFMQYELSDFIDDHINGDINSDGVIDWDDIIMMIQIILNQIPSEDIIELADYNHDGFLNIFDVIQMSDFVTGQ